MEAEGSYSSLWNRWKWFISLMVIKNWEIDQRDILREEMKCMVGTERHGKLGMVPKFLSRNWPLNVMAKLCKEQVLEGKKRVQIWPRRVWNALWTLKQRFKNKQCTQESKVYRRGFKEGNIHLGSPACGWYLKTLKQMKRVSETHLSFSYHFNKKI